MPAKRPKRVTRAVQGETLLDWGVQEGTSGVSRSAGAMQMLPVAVKGATL